LGDKRFMSTAVFLQVRLNSSRLSRKALLPLGDMTVIEHAMAALSQINVQVRALLTDSKSSTALRRYAKKFDFEVFEGPEDDVLSRFAMAVKYYKVGRYFRATGDNPLVSRELSEFLLRLHIEAKADFSGFLGPPLGTGVELTESEAILAADAEAVDPYEREHVSPFIYRRPERFSVQRPWAPEEYCYPAGHVTLDTREDHAYIERIFQDLYKGHPIETKQLVKWLAKDESGRYVRPIGKTG
jgi:spore coat polysaccharide biosynthesis protein SpsF